MRTQLTAAAHAAKGSRPNASGPALDTIPGGPSTAFDIDPRSTTSSIEFGWVNTPGDADWYRMPVTAGTQYTIILSGYSSASGGGPALPAPLVRVYDASGQLIGSGTGGAGQNASYTYTATSHGSVFVSAEGANGATGRYSTLVVSSSTPTQPPPPAPPPSTIDTVPGDASTTSTVAIGGAISGRIDSAREQDWHRVELRAGVLYAFELDSSSGPGSAGFDPYLELRNASGVVVEFNDDDLGSTGLDSRLTYMPTSDGTFYLAAQDFLDGIGDYRLTATTTPLSNVRSAIDWGTKVAGNVVTVFFIGGGETHDGYPTVAWNAYEKGRAMAALQTFADITPLTFVETGSSAGATFRLALTTGMLDGFGQFDAPGEVYAGLGIFQRDAPGWDEAGGGGLEAGGLGFATLVHEFGHGLGLAHPHDNGGTSTLMPGVNGPFDSFGVQSLNQGVFTVMTYNDGWPLGPDGAPTGTSFGYQRGPMALDIAVLQTKYGANLGQRAGDTTYVLPGANGQGTSFAAIWDGGGIDTIAHDGSGPAYINLQSATIDYSATGGGVVSRVIGVQGGLTIAAGVLIENARGGSGADTIDGNAADNTLFGRDGADTLFGRAGSDLLAGEGGDDVLWAGAGGDRAFGGGGRDLLAGEDGDDVLWGGEDDDRIYGGPGADQLVGEGGFDVLWAGEGDDRVFGNDGIDLLVGEEGRDELWGGEGHDRIYGSAGVDQLIGEGGDDELWGGTEDDFLYGYAGDDLLFGETGADLLFGDQGADLLVGQAGDDTIWAGSENDRGFGSEGADLLVGEGGADELWAGSEDDRVFGGAGADLLVGEAGDDVLWGGSEDDRVYGAEGRDQLVGESGDDVLFGGTGDDQIFGSDGADLLVGEDGADQLYGGAGADTLNGAAGDDVLVGEGGADRLTGGAGADVFVFRFASDSPASGHDTIEDFQRGLDTLDLRGLRTGAADALSIETRDGSTFVTLDQGGDGTADFVVVLAGLTGLTTAEVLFVT
jgi:serralysin